MMKATLKLAQNAVKYPDFHDCEFLCPGLVNYKDIKCGICNLDKEVIDEMLPSLLGKPLTILHQKVTPQTLEKVANGYVVNAYYDPASGKYRAKFIATTDEAKNKIDSGWKVSCAYDVLQLGEGGKRHAVPYDQNILKGVFTHLALVPPDKARYEESTIDSIAPEMLVFNNAFGEGNISLDKPKQEAKNMALKFKFQFPLKVENSTELDIDKTNVEVKGKQVPLKALIEAYNSKGANEGTSQEIDEDTKIEFTNSKGETESVSVKDLVSAFNASEAADDEDESKKKKVAEEEEKVAMENMSDDEKCDYGKADDSKKKEMRNAVMKRKNDMDIKDQETKDKQVRENSIKVKGQEEARSSAQKHMKTFVAVNSKGRELSQEAVAGLQTTTASGSTREGKERGDAYFGQKFPKKA